MKTGHYYARLHQRMVSSIYVGSKRSERLTDAELRELAEFCDATYTFNFRIGLSCSDSIHQSARECYGELLKRKKNRDKAKAKRLAAKVTKGLIGTDS